ncbi:MAG: hypothetical protein ABIQ72_11420 [Usitatibacter sp.]
MGMPVRLSDELAALAKSAADEATRSLTAQVEHWALLGRAVENVLDHATLTALKSGGGNLAAALPDPARRTAVLNALLKAVRGMDRAALKERISAGGGALYGVKRARPDIVVRYEGGAKAATGSAHEKRATYAVAKKRRKLA